MRKLKSIKYLLALVAYCTCLSSFAHEGHDDAFSKNSANMSQSEKIYISKEGEEAIGLETKVIRKALFQKNIEVTGQVQATDKGNYDLSAPISGLVREVFVKEGDRVNAGQRLASLESIEAANLIKDLLNQKASLEKDIAILNKELELNKTNLEREELLLNEGISPRKDFLNAQNLYENTKVSLEASKKQLDLTLNITKNQLKIMGIPENVIEQAISSGQASSMIYITAPISGVIAFRNLTPGETVQTDKKLFSIVDLSPIWIIVNIYQEQIPLIKLGLPVIIKSSSGEELRGQVSSIGATVEASQRTLPVRIVSKNSQETLKPGMSVTAEILYGESLEEVISLPGSAILEENARKFSYVKYDDFYQKVFIKTGLENSSEVEVTDGLYEGDLVVVKGAKQLQAQGLLSNNEDTHDPEQKSRSGVPLPWILSALAILVLGIFISIKRTRNK